MLLERLYEPPLAQWHGANARETKKAVIQKRELRLAQEQALALEKSREPEGLEQTGACEQSVQAQDKARAHLETWQNSSPAPLPKGRKDSFRYRV